MLSAVVDRMAVGDGLKDGELVAVVIMGAVEMTDAVFVAPTVVPVKRKGHRDINRKFTFSKADSGDAVCPIFHFGRNKTNCLTSEGQTGDTGAGERHHCIYSQSGGCGNRRAAHKARCARHLREGVTGRIER